MLGSSGPYISPGQSQHCVPGIAIKPEQAAGIRSMANEIEFRQEEEKKKQKGEAPREENWSRNVKKTKTRRRVSDRRRKRKGRAK